MVWFITYFFIILFAVDVRYRKVDINLRKALFVFTGFAFILLYFSLNLKILPDVEVYKESYENYQSLNLIDEHYEKGYNLLTKIFTFFEFNFYSFRIICILLSTILFFRGIFLLSKNISISLLYFYTCVFVISVLVQIRVGMGLSLYVCFGLPAYKQNKLLKSVLFIIFACFFHTSMIMLLIPYFFTIFKTVKSKLLILILSLIFVKLNLVDLLLYLAQPFLGGKLQSYIYIVAKPFLSSRDYLTMVMCVFFAFKTNSNKFDNFMYWNLFCSLFFHFIFSAFGEISVRFYLLYSYSLIFLMPLAFKLKNPLNNLLIYGFGLLNFYLLISKYGNGFIIGAANW